MRSRGRGRIGDQVEHLVVSVPGEGADGQLSDVLHRAYRLDLLGDSMAQQPPPAWRRTPGDVQDYGSWCDQPFPAPDTPHGQPESADEAYRHTCQTDSAGQTSMASPGIG